MRNKGGLLGIGYSNLDHNPSTLRDHPVTFRDHPGTFRDHPVTFRDHPTTIRDHPVTLRDHPSTLRDHPATLWDHPSTLRDHPTTLRDHPSTFRDHPETFWDHPSTLRDHPATLRDHPSTLRDHPSTLRDHPSTLRDHPATLRDHPSTLRDHPSTLRDHPSTLRDHPATLRDHPSTLWDHPATLRDHPETFRDHPSTLRDHPTTLRDHPSTFRDHPETFWDHPSTLRDHPATLRDHPATLRDHPTTLRDHPTTLRDHPSTFRDHPETFWDHPTPSGTTQAPSGTTQPPSGTTQPPSGTTQPPSGTTQPPSGTSSIPSSSGSSDFCQGSRCGGDAACVNLNKTGFCLCVEGYYYSSSSCLKGKTFPGYIIVQDVETTDLDDKSSLAYEELHNKVTTFFETALNTSDYGQTVILKVSILPSLPGKSEMRADNKRVNASVVNILKQSTSLSEENVTTMIKKAIPSNQIGAVQYEEENRCEFYGCVDTDQDKCSNGLQCECKPGLQRPNQQSSFCVPLECPDNCSAELKKQCLKKDSGQLECVCQPGYREDDNSVCLECPFGYSGLDCEDQFQLILTIVGTIAGILILGLLISLICLARSKNKKNHIEEQKLIDNDFQNLQMQSTGFSNLGADGSLFPKVKTSTSKDIHVQNPYANQRGVPRPDY
ncbi:mucin-13 [Sciurus carolinensis]|uniref:mucin-13 n=1 Tax=Sciurus carolinensis TaxID=30640 RepID=UPI001FB27B9B|nr:mucin-13 [Sciurus carolinensis]